MTSFEAAEQVANAVLYEGYLLYPYRASSAKNRVRWQFGVVMPRAWSEHDGSETWHTQTETLIEGASPTVDIRVRFLHLQVRTLEVRAAESGAVAEDGPDVDEGWRPVDRLAVGGTQLMPWDEAVEQQVDRSSVLLEDLLNGEVVIPIAVPATRELELVRDPAGEVVGRIVRTRSPIHGQVRLSAARADGVVRLRLRIENETPVTDPASLPRDTALRLALLGAHALLAVRDGAFISLLEPPESAAAAARACQNLHTWPVLVGEAGSRDLVLSSPIILYDYPQIAPESHGDLFDSTEIDEILTLRVLTLTEEEKQEARATDPRAGAIIDRSDGLDAAGFDRLHGAVRKLGQLRSLGPDSSSNGFMAHEPFSVSEPLATSPTESFASGGPPDAFAPTDPIAPPDPFAPGGPPDSNPFAVGAPYWDPPARVPPEEASVSIAGHEVRKGSRVILRPGPRGDTLDLFLAGRVARVEAVFESVDDETYVAVTVESDPAAELHGWYGRYFYFRPTELEPLVPNAVGGDAQ